MRQEIVLASANPGKLRELRALLAPLGIRLLSQGELAISSVPENGLSFEENALLKARHAARHAGLPAIADDSGLEVDALDGAPGIYSARYAGPGATDADNNRLLLRKLEGVPEARRNARFRCCIAYLRRADDPAPLICQGARRGAGGRARTSANPPVAAAHLPLEQDLRLPGPGLCRSELESGCRPMPSATVCAACAMRLMPSIGLALIAWQNCRYSATSNRLPQVSILPTMEG